MKIDRETAQAELDQWFEAWDIDTGSEYMDKEDRGSFEAMTARLLRKIQDGSLTFDDDSNPGYTPRWTAGAEALTFKVPSGADRLSWDKYKERENVHKIFSTLAAMTGKEPKFFAAMDGRDLKVVEAIGLLYLGS